MTDLATFVRESNAIEGIHRDPTQAEIEATWQFVALDELSVSALRRLVSVYQPDAVLRDRIGLNVRVGAHIAPAGGRDIPTRLIALLAEAERGRDPWSVHLDYETLHPFTDGNGRSGRALWLWQMNRRGGTTLSFLHAFYYQTLQGVRS